MTATYNATLLGTDNSQAPLYEVRFLLRDTDITAPLLQDEEILFLLTRRTNVYLSAALGAELILTRLPGAGTVRRKRVGDLEIEYTDRASEYRSLVKEFTRLGRSYGGPFCGGISVGEATDLTQDSDWPTPAFGKGMHDDPAASGDVADERST